MSSRRRSAAQRVPPAPEGEMPVWHSPAAVSTRTRTGVKQEDSYCASVPCSETLLGRPRERNAELTRLPVEIRPLDAERGRGFRHSPAVVLQHRRDVVALEPQPGLAQLPGRREARGRTFEV